MTGRRDQEPPEPPARPLRSFELQIWEKAEHWQFYETLQAVDESDARQRFADAYGRGYRLISLHALS
jgi:hypothetical protein